jgi:PQQ-dependent dehydrogenase (methanol/ethanol family)
MSIARIASRCAVVLALGALCTELARTEAAPVRDSDLVQPPAADWLSYRGNYSLWGYTQLDHIKTGNASGLTLAWTRSMEPGSNQATPLVRADVMYLPHPGDVIEALDARTGERLWRYRRTRTNDVNRRNEQGGVVTMLLADIKRNIAIYGDRIFTITGDHHVVALDASDGRELWATPVGDPTQMVSSSGPIVAAGRVITGRSCDPSFAGGCFVTAHDPGTGAELWRRYLVPRPGEPGDETWNGLRLERRVHVGAWGVPAFDPELGLLYVGTSVPALSVEMLRGTPGADMLYSNSTLAIDIGSGAIRWHFQHLPRDNWDMDHVFERVLVETTSRPDPRDVWVANPEATTSTQLLTGVPGKTGIIWTLDRINGRFVWAQPTVRQNVIASIDARSGRATLDATRILQSPRDRYPEVCPSAYGGKNWPVSAYSPRTRALYLPLYSVCQQIEVTTQTPAPGDLYGLDWVVYPVASDGATGWLQAVSVETGRTLWRHEQLGRVFGALATAGGLIFAGDSFGRFMAFDEATGSILWSTRLHGSVSGTPISYAADGVQYVAVSAGGGDTLSGVADRVARVEARGRGNMLYVFRLPDPESSGAAVPAGIATAAASTTAREAAQPTSVAGPGADVQEAGEEAYARHCAACHGVQMRGAGHAPALTGCGFAARWRGRSLDDLRSRIATTMPPGAFPPLNPATADRIVDYWLQMHGGASTSADSPGATSIATSRPARESRPSRMPKPIGVMQHESIAENAGARRRANAGRSRIGVGG